METKKNYMKSLNTDGRKIFNETVEYLEDIGKFDKIDYMLIEILSRAYQTYKKHIIEVSKNGAIIYSKENTPYLSPDNMVVQQSINTILKVGKELGVGIFTRKKLNIEHKESSSIMDILNEE